MKLLQVLVTTCAVVGATTAFAGTITFDNGPTGVDLGGYYQGVTFGEGAQIISQETPTFPAHSGNFELNDTDISNPKIGITFANASSGVSFWYNAYIGMSVELFAPGGALISSNFLSSTVNFTQPNFPGTSEEFVSGATGIGSILITDGPQGTGVQDVTIDDLTASTVSGLPAPEATNTAVLLGIAGLGLVAMRRKLAHAHR